jgi:hypothetical protein
MRNLPVVAGVGFGLLAVPFWCSATKLSDLNRLPHSTGGWHVVSPALPFSPLNKSATGFLDRSKADRRYNYTPPAPTCAGFAQFPRAPRDGHFQPPQSPTNAGRRPERRPYRGNDNETQESDT